MEKITKSGAVAAITITLIWSLIFVFNSYSTHAGSETLEGGSPDLQLAGIGRDRPAVRRADRR